MMDQYEERTNCCSYRDQQVGKIAKYGSLFLKPLIWTFRIKHFYKCEMRILIRKIL